ncbi:MAG TPA: SCO family protein [Terriglobales bacterium]|nr:SCO family protein [Terriglobales bacterium]
MRQKYWAYFMLSAVLLAGVALVLSRSAMAADGAQSDYKGNPYWGANHFPNAPLITQDGKTVKFYDDLIKGKTVVINFIFTRCGNVCPLETAKMSQVYKLLGDRMGKDIFFYSITVDPKHDTPERLKEYAEKFHTGPGWYFLTGKKSDIDAVRKSIGMEERPNEDPLTGHTTSLTLGNEPSNQWFVDSSMDDPRYVASIAGDWLSSWKYAKKLPSYAQKPALDSAEVEQGASLFRTACAACHTVGQGDNIGPDLAGVPSARQHDWLVRFITHPDKMLQENDPVATALYKRFNQVNMPSLSLTEKDAESLINYINSRTAALKPVAKAEIAGPSRSSPMSTRD